MESDVLDASAIEQAGKAVEFVLRRDELDMEFWKRLGIAAIVVVGQVLLIWLLWFVFKIIRKKISEDEGAKIKSLRIGNIKILTVKQIESVIFFLLQIAKYLISIFQLLITVPVVFSLFPATKELAYTIFGYVLGPLKSMLFDAVKFIPNIITIVIILVMTRYVLRGLKFFARQIALEKLKIPRFYADWAWPSFNILRVLIYAFTIAIIYPHLPGSESRAFQGVSVFVGVIVSLGSSSAIGNLIAGLVITYMRPFKTGDLIKIKDITGFVVEKSPLVIRLRNVKNENITLPNLTVLNSDVINYHTFGEEQGLILHATITMGYDVPWRDVYDILIRAAIKTPYVEEIPKPFVLQTSLDDFYIRYEINVYTKEIEKMKLIYSLLYQNIQDEFKTAGISMYAPHYYAGTLNTKNSNA